MFTTKASPCKDVFSTGMNRGNHAGKPRFDRIPLWLLNLLQWPFSRIWFRPVKDSSYDPTYDPVELDTSLVDSLLINRLAALLERGAKIYGRDNWQRGAPLSRQFISTLRHLLQWAFGDQSEDHLAAVAFGVMTMMRFEFMLAIGKLPAEFADKGPMKNA